MYTRSLTLNDLTVEYLSTLPSGERAEQQPEVMRFVRWFGADRPLAEVSGNAVDNYQAQVESTGADLARRLTPLRAMFAYAEEQGYLTERVSKRIRFRRPNTRARRGGAAVEQPEGDIVQLTAEGHQQLKDELDRLVNEVRPQVSEALLEARRDKDIRENAPYDAAKQHQAYVEARIRELESILARSEVISQTATKARGRIGIGSTVYLRDLTYDEMVSYLLVSSSEANLREGKISVASPVGRALVESSEGSVVEVEAPAGKLRYRIEKVEE